MKASGRAYLAGTDSTVFVLVEQLEGVEQLGEVDRLFGRH